MMMTMMEEEINMIRCSLSGERSGGGVISQDTPMFQAIKAFSTDLLSRFSVHFRFVSSTL